MGIVSGSHPNRVAIPLSCTNHASFHPGPRAKETTEPEAQVLLSLFAIGWSCVSLISEGCLHLLPFQEVSIVYARNDRYSHSDGAGDSPGVPARPPKNRLRAEFQ